MLGVDAPADAVVCRTGDGREFRRLPSRYLTPRVRAAVSLARLPVGVSPLSGGLASWPGWLGEAWQEVRRLDAMRAAAEVSRG
jgi:hypothetical protein